MSNSILPNHLFLKIKIFFFQIFPRRKVKINETIQPDSLVAIYILDTLLKTEYVRLSILQKNYNQLFELWQFMSRIKVRVLRKIFYQNTK